MRRRLWLLMARPLLLRRLSSLMLAVVALVVSVLALLGVAALAIRLRALEVPVASGPSSGQAEAPLVLVDESPLRALRFGLAIEQDLAHPVFSGLLKEQLLRCDVAELTDLTRAAAEGLVAAWPDSADSPDLLISGQLVCNGYAEVYYSADLICFGPSGPICTLVERPPHGDRPVNLAIELVARLSAELRKSYSRAERQSALQELR